jgi:isoquinoline 1-oxidoreductase subunit beta
MSNRIALGRRSFLGSVTAIGGGFALGWGVPTGEAIAQTTAPAARQEVGIWVVISSDDTTTVRIARSEMGQGTFTGLAQLVADELDCDWKHVRAEYVSPDMNLAHKRAWGDMSTGGSHGIRGSQDYVRKGGAAARTMLIEAAAQRWGVPATTCKARPPTASSPTDRAGASCAMARWRRRRRNCRCRPT